MPDAFSSSTEILISTLNFVMVAYRKHTTHYRMSIYDADGDLLTIGSPNITRLKIGRDGSVPLLDVNSSADTANGSSITVDNPVLVILNQDDLWFNAGVYGVELVVLDNSAGVLATHVSEGIFVLEDTQLGTVGVS